MPYLTPPPAPPPIIQAAPLAEVREGDAISESIQEASPIPSTPAIAESIEPSSPPSLSPLHDVLGATPQDPVRNEAPYLSNVEPDVHYESELLGTPTEIETLAEQSRQAETSPHNRESVSSSNGFSYNVFPTNPSFSFSPLSAGGSTFEPGVDLSVPIPSSPEITDLQFTPIQSPIPYPALTVPLVVESEVADPHDFDQRLTVTDAPPELVATNSSTDDLSVLDLAFSELSFPSDLFNQLFAQLDTLPTLTPSPSVEESVPSDSLPPIDAIDTTDNPVDIPVITPDDSVNPVNPLPDGIPSLPTQVPDAIPTDMSPVPTTADENLIPTSDGTGEVVELDADQQDYDEFRQVFTAEGNVEMRFRDSVLTSDRLQVNLVNRIAVAEGNVTLVRDGQTIQGDRMEYYFVQGTGNVNNARGEIVTGNDRRNEPVTQPGVAGFDAPLSEILAQDQPDLQVTNTGSTGLTVGIGSSNLGGQSNQGTRRLRFEADTIDFTANGWQATNVRLTNDPFSPPELELRSNYVTYTRLSPTRAEIRARNPRLVFDQGFSLPLLRDRVIIDEEERNPALVQFGFDNDQRGGLYIERSFDVINNGQVSLRLTPQYFIQESLDGGDESGLDPSVFGLLANLGILVAPGTTVQGRLELTSLDLTNLGDDDLRASLRLRQRLGDYFLTLESSYRDRLFNGSLGFQNVQWSLGAVLTSPTYTLGDSGILFSYQLGVQRVNANISSDRRDDLLPPPPRENNRLTLTRYQIGATLSRAFTLWQGEALPATAEEGLRFTPSPVVPYVQLFTRLRGVASFYSSGDTQPVLTTIVGIQGQFGHFSASAFDYLGFNLSYSFTPDGPESPFNFDRLRDRQVLSGGISVQLFGPIRFGIQASRNVETGESISTDFILQYTRRTYEVTLRFNPDKEQGSIGLQINDFNWTGETEPFAGSESTSVYGQE
jgi:lipopolysaccharide export system protein LptA